MTSTATVYEKGIFRVHRCGLAFDVDRAPFVDNNDNTKSQHQHPPPAVLIMISGFPDTAASWSRLVPFFERSHVILTLAMPGYEAETLPREHRWGYRLQDIVTELCTLILQPYMKVGCPIHLVGHDWGSAIVLWCAAARQDHATPLIDKLVVLDVGVFNKWKLSLTQMAVMLCYQSFFAFVFVLSRLLPNEAWASPLLAIFPNQQIGPTPYETAVPWTPSEVKVHMLYPYLQLFWSLSLPPTEISLLEIPYTERIPQLFLFGRKKRIMFHSSTYVDALAQSDQSSYKELANAGHWLHWTHPKEVAHEMKLFLNR